MEDTASFGEAASCLFISSSECFLPLSSLVVLVTQTMARTPYLGLRGHRLTRFMIGSVVCPAYMLLGYNNAVFGGLVNLESFLKTFPRIDTVNAEGAEEAENARIQGTLLSFWIDVQC